MGIITHEVKNIFNQKSVILLIIITCIIYKISIIPKEREYGTFDDYYNTYVQMIEKYGNSMDDNEYKDFLEVYDDKEKLADEYIKNNQELFNLGINNYEEFKKIENNDGESKYQDEKLQNLYWKLYKSKDILIFNELSQMENIKMIYEGETFEIYSPLKSNDKKVINRYREVRMGTEIESLLPGTIFDKYETQFTTLTVLMIISTVLLISPIYLDDKVGKVNYLQYTSKHGRKVFKSKVTASVIASQIILLINVGIFLSVCLDKYSKVFLNCGISGYYNPVMRSWFDLSFGQYILLTLTLLCILIIVIALISFYISSRSNRYVSALGLQIPVIFIICLFLLNKILIRATNTYIPIDTYNYMTTWKYMIPQVYAIIIIIPLLIIGIRYKKEKQKDF